MVKQKVYVYRNPRSWKYPYSVRADVDDGRGYIVSQHTTKALATKAAKKVAKQDVLKVLGWR